MRTLHENPETAGAKMSALCSFCVHHVAVNGEAVNSNTILKYRMIIQICIWIKRAGCGIVIFDEKMRERENGG